MARAYLARMRSCPGCTASAWLKALPGAVIGLTCMACIVNARLWLGEELLPPVGDEGSSFCKQPQSGSLGVHCLLCTWAPAMKRHDRLRDAWAAVVKLRHLHVR